MYGGCSWQTKGTMGGSLIGDLFAVVVCFGVTRASDLSLSLCYLAVLIKLSVVLFLISSDFESAAAVVEG